METAIVHGGAQSVPVTYDNSTPSISEVSIDPAKLAVGRDWDNGAQSLVLWVYGDPNNAATEQMYVKITNAKQVINDVDLTAASWQNVSVDLTALGISLNNVTSLTIGFKRTGATGGSGIVFLDDIQLYKPQDE